MQKSNHSRKYKKVIQALRELREKRKLRQFDVSKQLGAYKSYVQKIETGERRLDVVELERLCDIYGVGVAAFLRSVGIE